MFIELHLRDPITEIKPPESNLRKQILASIATGLLSLCGGFTAGYGDTMIPRLKETQEVLCGEDYYFWFSAGIPLSIAFGCLFAGLLSDNFGRKYTYILMIWPFLIGYLIMAFTKTVTYLLLGQVLTGMSTGIMWSAGSVYMAEVADPKNRPIFQNVLAFAAATGILLSHVIGKYLSLKYSCLIFLNPILVAFVLLVFMKESPLWLISKGNIEEGVESFRWYRTQNDDSEIEISLLLEKQSNQVDSLFTESMNKFCNRNFLKTYVTGLLLFTIIQFGLNNFSFFVQDIELTLQGKMNTFIITIIIDVLRLMGCFAVVPLLKYCKRRKSFFFTTSIVIFLLIGIVLHKIIEPGMVSLIICLITFVLVSSLMVSLSWTFVSEIYSDDIRGIGLGISASSSYLLLFVLIQLTPMMIENFGIIAVYSTLALSILVSLIGLLYLLPDTNGKSLNEIEENIYKRKTHR